MWVATWIAMALAAIPALYALVAAPKGGSYLGFETNADDHMVYAAWMRQAMDGRFLFDNRFTTDPQPGLTIHLYFWALGQAARLLGIPLAAHLGRIVFTGLFVPLLYSVVRRVTNSVFATRLAVTISVLGGGIGFLVWHSFGVLIVRPTPAPISALMLGRLPIDVWQPEAFVFPSMLTNGLFMVSLCLILLILRSFLDAREGWKPVIWGAISMAVLMNIHSYDVVIVALVMVGLALMQAVKRDLPWIWLLRSLLIGAGAVVPALWFVHVLHEDTVFQARAATPTYSANFRQVFFGYVLMMALALPGLWIQFRQPRQRIGVVLVVAMLIGLFVAAAGAGDGYFLSPLAWAALAGTALVSLALLASESVPLNLLLAWAVMGLVALYFPALFQRKLAMGLSIPWAILATLGFSNLAKAADRNTRNLATVLVILILSASSIRWIFRDKGFIDANVSNTTVHPVYLTRDERSILARLNQDPASRKVVLAMPGIPSPELDAAGDRIPDAFGAPAMPDLNPIISGITGSYTYAGHWSETPEYAARRLQTSKVFLSATPADERARLLAEIRPDYLVAPTIETYSKEVADLSGLGEVVYSGPQFKLIRLSR